MNAIEKVRNNKRLILFAKIVFSICAVFIVFTSLFVYGLKPYYSYKDYSYQNDFSSDQAIALDTVSDVRQSFIARGNRVDNISVYIGEITEERIRVSIYPVGGTEVVSYSIASDDMTANSWNKLSGLRTDKLQRGKEYIVEFISDSSLKPLMLNTGDAPYIFGSCDSDGQELSGRIAMGIQFTYSYMTRGSFCELSLSILFAIIASFALCLGIFRVENYLKTFISAEKKQGFKAALFYSATLVLLYNPLESIRTEVSDFGRIMGAGLTANVDVSKTIGNFSHWFILFAICFAIFWLLFNHLYQSVEGEDNRKAIHFFDQFCIVANCSLILRCITYFNDEASITAVYYFTVYAVLMISLIALAYIVLKLEKNISVESYAKLQFIGLAVSLPLAVFSSLEWGKGRVLLGWWGIIAILIMIYCRFFTDRKSEKKAMHAVDAIAAFVSLLPLLTSMYIELIHIMNQYETFVAHPAKYYRAAILLYTIVIIAVVVYIVRKGFEVSVFGKWMIPVFVFGVSCLSVQIPLSSTYKTHLFESANCSILVSEFLNFGRIPIVEHYGGHMMTSVWEAIIYGVVNQDYSGAVVSPYSQMLLPFLVVLFYFLVREVWDEEMAPLVALLFPFYVFWAHYGLGMLIGIAAISYIKKNTYVRAALVWAAFVWCSIYRLDLSFAFGVAIIFSLFTYIVVTRNKLALKQLGITLGGWAALGLAAWCGICIVKGINPVNRLIEFLMISLSNQNWAYGGIGNAADTLFGWSYIIIPFAVEIGLLYTTFSKTMREKIGISRWMILLLYGWSYFGNYSRGLVRHSLAETNTTIVIWSGYLFIALFISSYTNNKKLFLPVFMVLILCNTLFVTDGNFTYQSIAEIAMDRPAPIIESWRPGRFSKEEYDEGKLAQDRYMTSWEQIKFDGKKTNRVELAEPDVNLERYVKKYEFLLSLLLEDDETFVDFMNKTLLFSLLDRENPVYVSQSPLQLSGEFTQEEFVKEISGVPLVLMPIDPDNYGLSNALDGLTNAYRYYKVSEYIYQNYQPLCQYGKDYAIWCLKDRTDKYKTKLGTLTTLTKGMDYAGSLVGSETIKRVNIELTSGENGSVIMTFTGTDPMMTELQTVIDTTEYIGGELQICVEYITDTDGAMQLFYTTDKDENYVGEKVVTENISGSGTAYFTVPITEYSRLRLDIPEGSCVEIKSFVVKTPVSLIEYGYDGPAANTDAAGNISYSYISALHNHYIGQLARIWAEGDKEKASENQLISELTLKSDVYTFDPSVIAKDSGNYLLFTASYDGTDTEGLYYDDDEQIEATIIMGEYMNDTFEEKCRYTLSVKEGKHDYIIRCSTDYYWYIDKINAVKIQSDGELYDVSMRILEGD